MVYNSGTDLLDMSTINIKVHFFRLIGFWQLVVEERRFPWMYFNVLLLTYYIGFMQIVQLVYIFIFETDLVQFIDRMVCSATYMEGTVKLIYHWVNRRRVRKLLGAYRTNFLLCSSHQSERSGYILKNAEKLANAATTLLYFLIISTAAVWSLTPLGHCALVDCKYMKLLPTWFPVDQSKQPAKTITYLLDLVTISYNAAILSVVNTFAMVLFVVISSQVEVLGDAVKNIKANAENELNRRFTTSMIKENGKRRLVIIRETTEDIVQERMEDLLKDCLKDHQKILRTIQLLESVYSPLLLFQSIISCVIICSVGVMLILPFAIPSNNQSTIDTIFKVGLNYFAYLLDAICELFIYSWCGFIIGEQTKDLHRSFYNSDWPSGTKTFRRNILLAITRANRPSNITAGKFQTVNLNSFALIMRASYSYLMVLYGLIKKLGNV